MWIVIWQNGRGEFETYQEVLNFLSLNPFDLVTIFRERKN